MWKNEVHPRRRNHDQDQLSRLSPLAGGAAVKATDRDRFMAKVRVLENGCWEWIGCVQDSSKWKRAYFAGTAPNPRGRFWLDGKVIYAHQAAWILFRGEIPVGLLVRHRVCDYGLCANPEHLELGTYADNSADMMEKGRGTLQRRTA
jgi:hypothetical protein